MIYFILEKSLMTIVRVHFLISCIISIISALSANDTKSLNGQVVDENSNPLKGALVTLGQLTDSTDSSGNFYFEVPVSIKDSPIIIAQRELLFRGNYLIANLNSPKQITVSQFDLCGRMVRFSNLGLITPGNHQIKVPFGKKRNCINSQYFPSYGGITCNFFSMR